MFAANLSKMYYLLAKFFSRLFIGFLFGALFASLIVLLSINFKGKVTNSSNFHKIPNNSEYNSWLSKNKVLKTKIPLDILRYSGKEYLLESQYLYKTLSVLCIIFVRNEKNAKAAQATWAQGCSDIELVKLNTRQRKIRMPVKQNKENSTWSLLCKCLMKIDYKHQWILIINDNTFALLENLRLLVAPLNYTKNYYLGHAVQFWNINYNTGQAGYLLSLGSLKELQNKLGNDSCVAETTYLNQEDFYIGKLLSTLNIFPQDTRDSLGLTTFHSFNWYQEFFSSATYYKMSVYPVSCCSSQSITFQATEADKMYMYYYLLYQLEVFHEGSLGNRPASTPVPEEQVWKAFLKERGIMRDYVSAREYYKIWEDLVHDPEEFLKEMRDKKMDYT
ncbi:hypothetical protein AMK59_1802 [Oryctes borbonicus]|uniref:Hexosyltransferase n=1 Tax=Oryctes borbonicus TaxID=1629725 RepID=A0A0T6BG69_9SCAR|nr:hypothetical protein AMK59_1802 [Oryctes borbonicus]